MTPAAESAAERRVMIVYLNCQTFEYDVHSLLKAFYPEEDVRITYEPGEAAVSVTALPEDIPSPDETLLYSGEITAVFFDGAKAADKSIEKIVKRAENVTRSELKNIVKIAIYELLCSVNRRTLPWGTLTGIRPTKIPMSLMNQGRDDEYIRDYLKNIYKCSDEKITLSMDIAKRENSILKDVCNKADGYSLYIGIPFCPTRCLYCSFTSYPIASYKKRVDEYFKCIKKELAFVHEQFKGKNPDTIYIGGGTPTSLSADELDLLLTMTEEYFDVKAVREFTVEAGRPDSITLDKLLVLKNHNVTRISVNPQTMNQATLDLIGRRHSVSDVEEAFNMARSAGFSNINMDIILGLPGENEEMLRNTLDKIEELSPDSLTVHSMAIKRAAGMHEFLLAHPDIESTNTQEMMAMSAKTAHKLSLKPYYLYRQKNMAGNYENVGYARESCCGLYNILIMEEVQSIVALGAGTVSKRVYSDGRIERCDNVKDVNMYIEKIDEMIERKRRLFVPDGEASLFQSEKSPTST